MAGLGGEHQASLFAGDSPLSKSGSPHSKGPGVHAGLGCKLTCPGQVRANEGLVHFLPRRQARVPTTEATSRRARADRVATAPGKTRHSPPSTLRRMRESKTVEDLGCLLAPTGLLEHVGQKKRHGWVVRGKRQGRPGIRLGLPHGSPSHRTPGALDVSGGVGGIQLQRVLERRAGGLVSARPPRTSNSGQAHENRHALGVTTVGSEVEPLGRGQMPVTFREHAFHEQRVGVGPDEASVHLLSIHHANHGGRGQTPEEGGRREKEDDPQGQAA